MYCRVCGKEVAENAVACMSCGCDPRKGDRFCPNCGAEVNAAQVVCVKCGVALKGLAINGGVDGKKDKTVAGALGAHEFYLGNITSAIIRLAVTLLTFGYGGLVLGIIGLIEGIIYLTKSEDEFQKIYVEDHKQWF